MEHEEQGRRLEREADDMEERSDNVGQQIDDARSDWEAKQSDSNVPGARAEESDQLPEEGQPEQVPDDSGGEARDEAEDTPGVPGEEGTATGNPDAAGAEEPDDDEK